MAVHIRLRRMGKKKQAFYRIVAADSRRARDGRFLEVLGTYNPIDRPATVVVKEDRLTYWLDEGAQTSDTVGSLLTQIGFTTKYAAAKKGQDVSEMEVKTRITERKKRTRQMKKAALAQAEAAKADEEAKKKAEEEAKKAAEEAAKAEEAPAEEAPAEDAPQADGDGEKAE